MSGPQITLLVTLTGRDRPGVTSRLFAALSAHELAVIDVEQVVIRGRLVLGVLLAADAALDLTAIHQQLISFAGDMGMDVEMTVGSGEPAQRPPGRLHVTLLGRPLLPSAVASIAGHMAAHGANIDRIGRLASRPVTCIEFEVSGADPVGLRNALTRESVELGADVAVQPGGLHRRAMRLVLMDVDSTLLRDEAIDLLAARAGRAAEVREITTAAMRGDLDFAGALHRRVELLAGLDASAIDDVLAGARLMPGARTLIRTLKRLGYWCGVVSGGFTQFTDWLTVELGLDFAEANTLEIAAGKLTGRVVGPIVDRPGKERALRRFAAAAGVALSQTVAVGDGANDLDMISAAGLGIAFNAKPAVRDAADTSLSVPHLDAILYLLGISREDVEEADAEDPALASDGHILRTLED
ncbi:MAG TPA: phosphoserine phosphatase SerB [Streptosporangiaceae bacterium]|nr:phosphoserine phosphatase SerB [Streptosporangiaceae bacterium]